MSEYPAGKFERGKILAQTALAVGKNYARYYARASRNGDRAVGRSRLNYDNGANVFENFTYLRGTALKLAQSRTMDTGILPGEFIEAMALAHYRARPMNRALIRAQIRR